MKREDARLELDATTLRPQDASAEARAMAERDALLGAWVEKRAEFDAAAADAFSAPAIPAALRDRILQTARVPEKKRRVWRKVVFLTAAAACVLLGWFYFSPVTGDMPAWQSDSLAAMYRIQHGMSRLDERTPDLEEVKKLLAATRSPSPGRLPAALAALRTFGCKRVQIAGRSASIICFKLGSGGEAHLVVLDNSGLDRAPPQLQPQFASSKNWHTASWSDGAQSFMLATTEDEAELKKMFGQS